MFSSGGGRTKETGKEKKIETENAQFLALILEQLPGEIPEIWWWMERKNKREREKHRDAHSVRECKRDADKKSMHSGQIFTCWVTFCIKLMYNWWKAFILMLVGTRAPVMNGVICYERRWTQQKDLKLYVRGGTDWRRGLFSSSTGSDCIVKCSCENVFMSLKVSYL